jgi:hypothetical protein
MNKHLAPNDKRGAALPATKRLQPQRHPMTCSIGMAALAAVSVFVALAAGMYAFLVRTGLRQVRDLEAGIDGDRDPEGLPRDPSRAEL